MEGTCFGALTLEQIMLLILYHVCSTFVTCAVQPVMLLSDASLSTLSMGSVLPISTKTCALCYVRDDHVLQVQTEVLVCT